MAQYYDDGEREQGELELLANRRHMAEVMSTPEGLAQYQAGLDKQNYEIANGLNGFKKSSKFDSFVHGFVDNIPLIYGAMLTAGAMGVFGGGAAGAGAAGGTAAGVGGTAAGTGGLGATAAGSGLGGLGAVAAEAAIPQIVITGTAGGAGLGGLGTAAAATAGAAGLGSMMSNGTSAAGGGTGGEAPMQQVNVSAPRPTPELGGLGGIGGNLPINTAALSQLPNVVSGGSGNTLMDQAKGVYDKVGGIKGIYDGLMPIIGGNVDRIKANQDADWWGGQINTLMDMYKPGTPEAEQMRQKMEAQDAATGRRSQYGVRAVNLATNLAEKRGQLMTSGGYQNMANAYRNRSSQDLNGLFAAAGAGAGGNATGNLISGVGGLVGKYTGWW